MSQCAKIIKRIRKAGEVYLVERVELRSHVEREAGGKKGRVGIGGTDGCVLMRLSNSCH